MRAAGYSCIEGLESRLDEDYTRLEKQRSLRFSLAYAEGFEAMALVIGQMLIEERVYLFGNSNPAVASLVLWHFVEEIEHKNVAYDVLHHLYPGYFLRISGLIYATTHIFLAHPSGLPQPAQGRRPVEIRRQSLGTGQSALPHSAQHHPQMVAHSETRLPSQPGCRSGLGSGMGCAVPREPHGCCPTGYRPTDQRHAGAEIDPLCHVTGMPMTPNKTITKRLQALLFLNGLGLLVVGILFGWAWFFHLLQQVVLWPLPVQIDVQIPGDSRAFRMGHMEAITQGLLLMALAFGGQFMWLSKKQFSLLYWTALVTGWMFTLPAMANTFFGTRGLALGGGPFQPGLANDVIYLLGWPPVLCVHVVFFIAVLGVYRFLQLPADDKSQIGGA